MIFVIMCLAGIVVLFWHVNVVTELTEASISKLDARIARLERAERERER